MYNKKYKVYETEFDFEYYFNTILRENLSGFSFNGNVLKTFIGIGNNLDRAKEIVEYFGAEYDLDSNKLIIKNIDELEKNVMRFIRERISQGKDYWVVRLLDADKDSEGNWIKDVDVYYFETKIDARIFAYNNKELLVSINKERIFNLKI